MVYLRDSGKSLLGLLSLLSRFESTDYVQPLDWVLCNVLCDVFVAFL